MFRKKRETGDDVPATSEDTAATAERRAAPAQGRSGAGQPAETGGGRGFRPEIARRLPELPGAPRSQGNQGSQGGNSDDATKKLIVGRDIVLSGEITACDRLLVEGRVEATLSKSRAIDIAETGVFKGSAEIDEAIVSGEFDGQLVVHSRLVIRATGRVRGDIRYGEIEIEAGGRITGNVQLLEGGVAPAKVPEPAADDAAEMTAAEAR